jgi:norsolorinic acid ketoreductase
MSSTTYLITGANRGLGKGFTATLLQRPNTTIIATVRNPAQAQPLLDALPKAEGSKLIILKLDSSTDTDAADVADKLQREHGITSLDVVIANAGICHSGSTVSGTSPDALREHFNINSVAPVLLFQALRPLLKESKTGNPIFVAISTALGSIGFQPHLAAFPPRLSPYGASKTALNWLVQRIHIEEPWLTAFVFHPGLVLTDMAETLAQAGADVKALGAIEVDQSIGGMVRVLDKATRDIGGSFQNYDGSVLPW